MSLSPSRYAQMRTGQGNEEATTLCPMEMNRSSGSGSVGWRGSLILFRACIASQLQEPEIPKARGEI